MTKSDRLYPNFKKDLAILMSDVDNKWLSELSSLCSDVAHSHRQWDKERRLVDRIDESLEGNSRWRDIRTAYGFRGTK